MATKDFIESLSGDIQLGLLVEGEVVPVVIGAIKGIKKLVQGETVTYTVAITTGNQNLDAAATNFTSALELINEERAKQGLSPVDIPGKS